MPKLAGLFDSFDNLDQIKTEDIARWLKPQPQISYIENYLAQRILYPQTVPTGASDMKIDLAILREALRSNTILGDKPFVNVTLRKILIPSRLLNFIPDLPTLTWAFVDGLLFDRSRGDFFEDLWTVEVRGDIDEVVGSILRPQFKGEGGMLQLTVEGKTYQVKVGTLMVIPCSPKRCEASFSFKDGKFLGKKDLAIEVYGGRLGLIIDGRKT